MGMTSTAKPITDEELIERGLYHEEVVGEVSGHPFKEPRPLVRYVNGAIVPAHDPEVIKAREEFLAILKTKGGYGGGK